MKYKIISKYFFIFLLLPLIANANTTNNNETSSIEQKPAYFDRLDAEHKSSFDPYIITPHKMTYFLPISYTNNINKEAYEGEGNYGQKLNNIEAKFQISLKIPLTREKLFHENDNLAFGFTLQSWWQLYNHDLSRPFRETNYQPEIFYTTPLTWQPANGKTNLVIGFEHQSNGRTQTISRSWNRLYATFTFAKDNYAISFRPWWKIPEGDKVTTPEESGNDNPDITDYMGHFELIGAYKWQEFEFAFTGRRNFKENKGAIELGMTFPLSGKLKGYLQYAQGYGENLIDYNHYQKRIGVGIALTEIF
ncbi:MAG: phospholipase [Gammaproteobacteria bacterium]|nr:MAG: phospholipase [Gammaproteobacteria bacterium]PHR84892.1 MAG: phospholipase [Colwellia sp.]